MNFTTWDLVRPRMWHPLASMEQSMMDLEHMTNHMMTSRFPFRHDMFSIPSIEDDDDFFKDLPTAARGQATKTKTTGDPSSAATNEQGHQEPQSQQHAESPSTADQDDETRRAYSTYSYSSSSVLDDGGSRVVSTRRRYEDSTGRLKAVHEREIGGKKARSTWNRLSKDDQGKHELVCSDGSPDEFEKAWQETPFGKAQQKQLTREDSHVISE